MRQWREITPGIYEGLPVEIALVNQNTIEEPSLIERLSRIPSLTKKTHSFDTWRHRGKESWWSDIKKYADGKYEHPFLTLLGMVGTGKTRLAWSIAWAWLNRGRSVLYYQVEELLDALREGYSAWEKGDAIGYHIVLKHTQNVGLLILDDFGAEHGTAWAKAKLDQIVDYRYVHQKPLIATTNLTLDQLAERVADRLSEGTLIQLMGDSFRLKKNEGKGKTRDINAGYRSVLGYE